MTSGVNISPTESIKTWALIEIKFQPSSGHKIHSVTSVSLLEILIYFIDTPAKSVIVQVQSNPNQSNRSLRNERSTHVCLVIEIRRRGHCSV